MNGVKIRTEERGGAEHEVIRVFVPVTPNLVLRGDPARPISSFTIGQCQRARGRATEAVARRGRYEAFTVQSENWTSTGAWFTALGFNRAILQEEPADTKES